MAKVRQNTYIAAYTINPAVSDSKRTVDDILTAVEELNEEGVSIEFLGARQTIDGDGNVVEITASYTAPTKGTIGRLNVRGELPACGTPVLQ